jgi:hypothetical protein
MLELGIVLTDVGGTDVDKLARSFVGTRKPLALSVDVTTGEPTLKELVYIKTNIVKQYKRIWIEQPNPFKKNPLILIVLPSSSLVYVFKKGQVVLKEVKDLKKSDKVLYCKTMEISPVPTKIYKVLTMDKELDYPEIEIKETHNYTINGILVHDEKK